MSKNLFCSSVLTLTDLFQDLSQKTMYQKYPAPGLVQECVPSLLIGMSLLKNGHTAPYQQPCASEMMQLPRKSVAMLSSLFFEKNGFE